MAKLLLLHAIIEQNTSMSSDSYASHKHKEIKIKRAD